MKEDEKDYAIGYGKPPAGSKFPKGASGNPKGRPRGSKNLATLLEHEFNQRVVVRENGRQRKITKREAVVKQFVNKLVAADPRYIQFLIRLIDKQQSESPANESVKIAAHEVIDPEAALKLQQLWDQLEAQKEGADHEKGGEEGG
jgi:hypothetical protein